MKPICVFVVTALFCINIAAGKQNTEQADDQEFGDVVQPDRSVFMPVPREILRPLIRASRLLREEDRVQAVALLGEVLSEPAPADYLVPAAAIEGAAGVYISLKVRAQQMLGSLSTDDRASYRLRYGTRAKQILDLAVEKNDYEMIADVMQRFFYTEAGYSAAMILGHYHLDHGRAVVAANCFQRVAELDEANQIHDPSASVLAASSWLISNSPKRATEVLQQLKRRQPNGHIDFEGHPIALFESDDQALKWLQNLIGESTIKDIGTVRQWLMFGGNPQRNARSGTGLPLIQPRWVVPTENHPDIHRALTQRQQQLIFLNATSIPALQPMAIGDTIVMRTFDRMIGIDFQSGKRTWVFPPWGLNFRDEKTPLARELKVPISKNVLTERFWQDSIYGQSSSDGHRIFVVPNPGFTRSNSSSLNLEIDQLAEPITQKQFNELGAIDLASEGAFRWKVGGLSGLSEPKLAKSFFLGAPLPLAGSLYAICQQDQQIKLVVLDPATGKLEWSQQLVSIEASANVAADRYRRLAGATPSFADGVLVCPTGVGALVAIDHSTRSLRWGYQFATPGSKNVARISPADNSPENNLDGLWKESTITIADGCVIHTPVDAQFLVCVDLESGFPKWNSVGKLVGQLPRNDSLFVACVDSGNVILVGRSSVRAIRLSDGDTAWELNTESAGRPSGRGYTNQGRYFLPMTGAQLLRIDLRTGTTDFVVKTDGVLGNLICYRGDVISHGVDRVAVYAQDEPSRAGVAAAEQENNLTPELLNLKSQLQYQAGELRESALSMGSAYDQSKDPRYGQALKKLTIDLLAEDYPFGIKLFEKYSESLFFNAEFDLTAAKINGLMATGQLNSAMDQLLELIQLVEQQPTGFENDIDILVTADPIRQPFNHSSTIRMSRHCWLSVQLKRITDQADDATLVNWQTQIGSFLRMESTLTPTELANRAELFPVKLITTKQLLDIARKLVIDMQRLRARQLLIRIGESNEPEIVAEGQQLLAEIFADCGLQERAVEMLAHDDAPIRPQENSDLKRNSINQGQTSYTDIGYTVENEVAPLEILVEQLDSADMRSYQFCFYGTTGELEVLDGNGDTFRRFLARQEVSKSDSRTGNYDYGELRVADDLVLLNIGQELFAMDWLKLCAGENPVLWNINISNSEKDQSSNAPQSIWGETLMQTRRTAYEEQIFVAAPSANGVCYLDGTNLICVDALTGKPRWQRANFKPLSMVYGDDQQVVVWNQHSREVVVCDIVTGAVLKQTVLDPELGALWTNQGSRLLMTDVIDAATDKKSEEEPASPGPDSRPGQESQSKQTWNEGALSQRVGLYDLLAEQFIWRREYPPRTLACQKLSQQLFVLPPVGNLEVIELADGRISQVPIIQPTEWDRKRLDGIGIVTQGGSTLLLLKQSGDASNRIDLDSGRIQIRHVHYFDTMWSGHLLALDEDSYQTLWDQPVRLEHFQIAKRIPNQAPVLTLVRRIDRDDRDKYYMQFVMLDLKTGQSLVNTSIPFEYRNHYVMRWLPETNRMEVNFSNKRLTASFDTVADAPPRPVASLTMDSSILPAPIKITKQTVSTQILAQEMAELQKKALAAEQEFPQFQAAELQAMESEQ